eukprot:scaffold27986_cov53-Cyclotella_meneghiniana.AAC.1
MALKERWNCSGRKLGVISWAVDGVLTGDEKQALAGACAISTLIRGRAVVVGVRENADFSLAQYHRIRGRGLMLWV